MHFASNCLTKSDNPFGRTPEDPLLLPGLILVFVRYIMSTCRDQGELAVVEKENHGHARLRSGCSAEAPSYSAIFDRPQPNPDSRNSRQQRET